MVVLFHGKCNWLCRRLAAAQLLNRIASLDRDSTFTPILKSICYLGLACLPYGRQKTYRLGESLASECIFHFLSNSGYDLRDKYNFIYNNNHISHRLIARWGWR